MGPLSANPPDDLDRLAAAWALLQTLLNARLPYYAGQMAAARGRIAK